MEDIEGAAEGNKSFLNWILGDSWTADDFAAFRSRLLNWLISHGFPLGIAEDAIQEAFVVAMDRTRRGNLAEISYVHAWLKAVAVSKALSAMRRRREIAFDGLEILDTSSVHDVDDEDENKVLGFGIRQAMARLSEGERLVIMACFFEGCTIKEAASRLGMSLGKASGLYTRGKDAMRSILLSSRISGISRNDPRFYESA